MGCDCNCAEVTVDCNCPSPSPINGASLSLITSTGFDGAPADIYNSGNGYIYTLYTNTTTNNQEIRALTNIYVTSDSAHDLKMYHNLASLGPITEANAYKSFVAEHNLAPVKTTSTAIFYGDTLAPGNSLYLTVKSTDSTARMAWLTTFIYKYDY